MTLSDNDKLYRFINYETLLDYLVNKRFSFSKCTLFKDPWELFFNDAEFIIDDNDSWVDPHKEHLFAMCFTKTEESEALWRIHSKNESGVKIVSSVEKLKILVKDSYSAFDVYLQEMVYDDNIKNEDFFINKFPNAKTHKELRRACLFLKRKAFEYEQEVRLVLDSKKERPDENIHHIFVEDPNEIIEKIVLNPLIDNEMAILQRKILTDTFGFKGDVAKSHLYTYNRMQYKTNINPFPD